MPFFQIIHGYAHDLIHGVRLFVLPRTKRIEQLYHEWFPGAASRDHFGGDPEIERLNHERRNRAAAGDLDGEVRALAGIGNRLLKTSAHDHSTIAECVREIEAVQKRTSGACTVPLLRLSGVGSRLRQKIDPAPSSVSTSSFSYAHAALVDAMKRPLDPAPLAIAGRCYKENGQYKVARDCFARFDALGGADNGESDFLLGQCFLQLGQYSEASDVFERAVREGYPALAVSALQARALLETGDAQGALEQAELALSEFSFGTQGEQSDDQVNRAAQSCSIEMLLVAARACECLHDYSGMLKHAQNALRLDRDNEDAHYWKLRAELHGTAPLESPPLDERLGQADLRWNRLFAAMALHRNETPDAVRRIVDILKGTDGKLDEPERQLFLALARKAMIPSLTVNADLMSKRREICEQIRATLYEPIGWVTTNIGIDLLIRQNQYSTAWNELSKDECLAEELGRQLADVAAVLVAQQLGTPKALPCVEAVRQNVLMLLGMRGEDGVSAKSDLEHLAMHLDDSLVSIIPGLRRVVTGLLVISKATSRTENFTEQLTGILRDPVSPQWLRWLVLRVRLLHGDRSAADLHEVNHFALAWTVEQWWFLFGSGARQVPTVVAQSCQFLDLGQVSKEIGSVRAAREGHSDVPETVSLPSFANQWNLGDLGKVCDHELELETAFLRARRTLTDGRRDESASQFESLLHRLQSLSLLTSQWWHPVLEYWHGVALLLSDKQRASVILAGLGTGGPKSPEACAQLALVAASEDSLETAEKLLSGVTPTFPAGAYAHSLINLRRGNVPQARAILESFDNTFAPGQSPYCVAARRLLAALEERSGNLAVAERMHRDVIASTPGDPISCARLERLLVKNAYDATRSTAIFPAHGMPGGVSQAVSSPFEWSRPYKSLWELLSLPEQNLAQAGAKVAAHQTASQTAATWSEIIVWRLLRSRRTEDAAKFLQSYGASGGPIWYERARLGLRAWYLLKNVWTPHGEGTPHEIGDRVNPDIPKCVMDIDAELMREPHPVLQRWRLLLTQAISVLKQRDANVQPNVWRDLAPWPVAQLPGLFSSSEQERATAARIIGQVIDTPDFGWSDAQHWLLRALLAATYQQDEAYLSAYTTLESALDELPVDGTALWLEAASIWFRRKDWTSLLEGQLPSIVETLSNPNVRLLIGFAYARAAADDANGDIRRASKRARQARSTLEGLFDV